MGTVMLALVFQATEYSVGFDNNYKGIVQSWKIQTTLELKGINRLSLTSTLHPQSKDFIAVIQ